MESSSGLVVGFGNGFGCCAWVFFFRVLVLVFNRFSRNLASWECREKFSCFLRRYYCFMWSFRRMRYLLRRAFSCRRFFRRVRYAFVGEVVMGIRVCRMEEIRV